MEKRMDRKQAVFSTAAKLRAEDREYWSKASVEEKSETITYLRECFYGPEATTGRLQRVYKFFKRK